VLKLNKITKVYQTDDYEVKALKEVSLSFRSCEFVSILGASGSGKTTLLNIIGGLDKYTSGDLIIGNKSTKEFSDYDWDSYRNHKVGFVFQSYNLIPHQTALANVELALTLSGVNKTKRRKKAIEVLKSVGLGDQIYKKPNQMSGGQTQRVAIARALVNDPDILLADEPTGALDTETSKQIMQILKDISKEKLVIMVTHNPELAEEYSTRIIRVSDGQIKDDSDIYESKVVESEKSKTRSKKNFMSFKTAFGLSLNNLATKKGRTILTSFAGAIGIIGIALIMSISHGVQEYINNVEEDTLSSYPLTIESQKVDMTSFLESIQNSRKDIEKLEEETVVTNNIMGDMISMMSNEIETNDLEAFKKYVEKNEDKFMELANAIQYSYNLNLQIYKDSKEVVKLNPSTLFSAFNPEMTENYMSLSSQVFTEFLDNDVLIKEQYEVLAGKMPSAYDEVVLIVDNNNMISDFTAYSLGLKDKNELTEMMKQISMGNEVEFKTEKYSYDDLLKLKFKVLLNTDYYKKQNGIWINKESDDKYVASLLDDALTIKVVGIVKVSDESVLSNGFNYGSIGYTHALTEYVINKNNASKIAKEQKENPQINIFTGMEFSSKTFDYSNLTFEEQKYLASLTDEELANLMNSYNTSTYENNLVKIGVVDKNSPYLINIYPKDFESKDAIKDLIDEYNSEKSNEGLDTEVISYTDYVSLIMSGVTTIVNVISYVLIAFVSVSLVVSSIMIGIITYISVLERTKEIGILRSIGASKKDISRVFNAETFIIGSLAGILGIVVTVLLNIPINIIIKNLTGISTIAVLPIVGAIALIIISMILTIIAGLIPSKMASKKDPVIALRSE